MIDIIVIGAGPPGFELASTHSDAWRFSVPASMLVVGAGATGVQVASIFNAYGSRIQLFQTGPRILPSEPTMTTGDPVSPIGSFTDPEYAQVGLTEAKARETHEVVVAVVRFDSTTRTIIDGRKVGFCKLIVDRTTCRMLGCHVVGERAVEITQVAAIAIAAKMRVDDLAHIPLSFPTYAGILARVAASAARELNLKVSWQAHQAESTCLQF
jgi:pyruvate/2-oxoglutarate dehydrogenase complex dihydrolipoamide dehydrogenase (E3) component